MPVIGILHGGGPGLRVDQSAGIEEAARTVGHQIIVFNASTESEIDSAFAAAAQQGVGALMVNGDAFYNNRSAQFAAAAARFRIPTTYPTRLMTEAGGLMSYGDDREGSYREAGVYVGRILNGEKPGDLPVLQPTKFEFVINLKTAKSLGISFPPSFHLRANEVIE
jgi:putative ABC transport system substrate-binding protein